LNSTNPRNKWDPSSGQPQTLLPLLLPLLLLLLQVGTSQVPEGSVGSF
jgi:hypothetical protein